jgi:UDP-glucuronate 4-epimerase
MTDRPGSKTGLPSRVLVTGAAGFIGSHLCDRLLADGCRVIGLDNFDSYYPEATKRANLATALQNSGMRLIEGDIRDGVLLEGLFTDVPLDAVIHLAARPGVRPSLDAPEPCIQVNVGGTLQLLEAMRRHHVGRLVFGSSSSVYGNSSTAPYSEDQIADRPISPYAASKRAGELLVHTYHHLYGLAAVCLRFFTVFGPRQRPDLAIHKFARLMRAGQALPIYGDGQSGRDYTYVEDAVEAIVRSLRLTGANDEPPCYEVLNVGRSEPVTLNELLDHLETALRQKPRLDRQPMQPGDVSFTSASTDRVERVLGFRPRVGLEEGLERFATWFDSVASNA